MMLLKIELSGRTLTPYSVPDTAKLVGFGNRRSETLIVADFDHVPRMLPGSLHVHLKGTKQPKNRLNSAEA